MTLVDVYGGRREAKVMDETWGHLAPQTGREYAGSIVYTHGCFGDLTIISVEFDGLDDSPWLFEHLNDWLLDQDDEAGRVYRFEGTYCRDRDGRFIGQARGLDLASLATGSQSAGGA